MKVEKTGKVIKAEPRYAKVLSKFLADFFEWDINDYLNLTKKKAEPDGTISHTFYIKPDFLLLPAYRYSPIPNSKIVNEIGAEPKYDDIIRIENLSLFDEYQIINKYSKVSDIEIKVWASSCFECKKVKIWGDVGVEFTIASDGIYESCSYGVSTGLSLAFFDENFKTLRWARGRKYSDFSWKSEGRSQVVHSLYNIEFAMFSLLNFFYTLYNGNGFRPNTAEYNLFKPYIDLLQSYGDTFEGVLSTINESLVFTW